MEVEPEMNEDKRKKISAVPGLAVLGSVVTGVCGIVAVFSDTSAGGGLALLASAMAFSSMLYIAYK